MAAISPLSILPGITEEAARFRAHPAFQEAVRVSAEALLSMYEGQPMLNKLVSEEARWMIGGFAMYLHFMRDPADPTSGATLARLQALSTAHGLASAGRVAALVGLMRVGGHLIQKTTAADRRVKRLEPSEVMLAYARPWLAAHLQAIALLGPNTDFSRRIDTDPEFIQRFYREAGTRFLSGGRVIEATPDIRLFMGRDAGYMILLQLWLSDPSGAIPPRGAVTLPYQQAGRSFGLSRSHVRKLMEAAAAKGFVRLHAEGGRAIEVLPPLVDLFETSLSLQLANIAHCARVAAR